MCSIVVNVPDCQSGDWSSILSGGTNAGLDEVVKSSLFQGEDYGFESHIQYYLGCVA